MSHSFKYKWFNRTQHEAIEISDITDASYQPSIDDVGTMYLPPNLRWLLSSNFVIRIVVEATLKVNEGKECKISREIGPIVLDEQIESDAEAYLQTHNSFNITIESVEFEFSKDQFSFPCEGTLEINSQENQVILSAKNNLSEIHTQIAACDISFVYPQIKIQRSTRNKFDIDFGPSQTVRLSCGGNTERDVYCLCIRTVATTLALKSESKLTSRTNFHKDSTNCSQYRYIREEFSKRNLNFEMLMKLSHMSYENFLLKKENALLNEELESEMDANARLESQIKDLNEQLVGINKTFDELLQRNAQSWKLNSEKIACMQEINLYRNEIAQLKQVYADLKNGTYVEELEEERDESTLEIEVEKNLKEVLREMENWKTKALNNEIQNEALKSEIEKLAARNATLKQENETLENQLKELNCKYQSLLQENDRSSLRKLSIYSQFSDNVSPRLENEPSTFTSVREKPTLGEFDTEEDLPDGLLQRKKSKCFTQDSEKEKQLSADKIKKYEDEIEALKNHVTILTKTLDT